jgi:hypothetical protein
MKTAWIKDYRFDLGFIVGIAFLAAAMSGVTVYWPLLFIPMLTVHSWLFGYEHLWATYSKLVAHPDDRARHRTLIYLVPPLVLLGIYSVGQSFGLLGLYLIYFVGQLFHTVRQSWGLAQQYRRQAGGLTWDPVRLSEITLWSVPIWGFLHRCSQRPDEFLFQDFWLPPVPRLAVHIAAVSAGVLWSYWFYTRISALRRGELALGHTLYMISHLLVFLSAYVLIDELCSGWLLVNVWHNVQYIAFVWIYNRNRFSTGIDSRSRVLSWLSQRGIGRTVLYLVATVALALPLYYLLPQLGAMFDSWIKTVAVPIAVIFSLTLTFHHYIADGIIWKRRNNPETSLLFEGIQLRKSIRWTNDPVAADSQAAANISAHEA